MSNNKFEISYFSNLFSYFVLLLLFSSSIIPQLLRHNIFSKLTLVSLFLFLDIILVPWENIRSEEAEIAKICKYFRAIKNNTGNLSLLALY
jgi:hypothetical protein